MKYFLFQDSIYIAWEGILHDCIDTTTLTTFLLCKNYNLLREMIADHFSNHEVRQKNDFHSKIYLKINCGVHNWHICFVGLCVLWSHFSTQM